MERTYYKINESAAKTAQEMMSFSSYKEGSRTEEYINYANKAYKLAEKIALKRPNQKERAFSIADRYSKKMAEYINRDIYIGCMCPSVMIAGPSNFPVRKKEKQTKAWENNFQFYQDIQRILKKLESILDGCETIKSSDDDAIERLEEKLEALKEKQEEMKAVNKALRMKDIEKGNEELLLIGYSEEQIAKFREPDFCGRIGYPQYALQNNNANIHRVEERLKSIKDTKQKGTSECENQFFRVVENTEVMRLQIFFAEKPEENVRAILKSNGFKWAPSQNAWQRQLTANARYALKRIIKELKELKGIPN